MEDNYISIDEMIKRDNINKYNLNNMKNNNAQKMFQIQGTHSDKIVDIQYIGQYTNMPSAIILKQIHDNIDCIMLSYLVTENEIKTHNRYRMIGYVFMQNEELMGTLNYIFVPACKPDISNNKIQCDGHFEIVFEKKQNNKVVYNKIEKILTYCGREESIYKLTEVLLENDIIEKVKII